MKMIINLFRIFDPSNSTISFNWIMLASSLLLLQFKTIITSKRNMLFTMILVFLKKEINPLMTNKNNTSIKIIISIFLIIFFINISSLFPYNFTITSQAAYNFPIATTMWIRFLILGWSKKTKNIIAHLLPTGTPTFLIPIIILIELISQIIRPITLSVRLTANIVAGHLLLSLLRSLCVSNKILFISLLPVSLILSFLEICVSIIQAYVFITLLILYSTEIN